jgi:hypothetical protein
MHHYVIATSASLFEKAETLERLAQETRTPGHAAIYRRVASINRTAAVLARLAETAG